ncbi:MAG: MFS transporter [Alphaproteobacteria bacterium]|nr:MFS transporter [Alphaproteobacteria bacterium]
MSRPRNSRDAALMVAVLVVAYTTSQFYRAANGVIGPELMRDVGIGPEGLATLTSAFFFTFALCQIPLGLALDRHGPRWVMASLMIVAAAGGVVFSLAEGLSGLTFGRVLLGIGCCGLLIGPLVVYSRWFPADRFATVSGIHVGLGTLGNLFATAPLAALTATIGWRGAFLGSAVFVAAIAVLVAAVVRDAPFGDPWHQRKRETVSELLSGLGEALTNRQFPYVFALMFTAYGVVITLVGLWGGPYLRDVFELEVEARGKVLLVPVAAGIVGYLAGGPLDRILDTRKWITVVGVAVTVLCFAILAAVPTLDLIEVTALFLVIGLAGGTLIPLMAHGRTIFPARLVGRGMTALNIGSIGGAAVIQALTGYVIGQFAAPGMPAPIAAYQAMFATMGGVLLVTLLIYMRLPDAKPSEDAARSQALG